MLEKYMTFIKNLLKKVFNRRNSALVQKSQNHLKVAVGSGPIRIPGWLNTNIDQLNVLKRRDWEKQFDPATIDVILAEHVWEHLTPDDGLIAARYCFEFLKPGGHLRLAVPDGYHPREEYIEAVKPGGFGDGSDDHKILYTHESLATLLTEAGFNIRLLEYFDHCGDFHEQPWNASQGQIRRSAANDPRNKSVKLTYTSLSIDGIKPA